MNRIALDVGIGGAGLALVAWFRNPGLAAVLGVAGVVLVLRALLPGAPGWRLRCRSGGDRRPARRWGSVRIGSVPRRRRNRIVWCPGCGWFRFAVPELDLESGASARTS